MVGFPHTRTHLSQLAPPCPDAFRTRQSTMHRDGNQAGELLRVNIRTTLTNQALLQWCKNTEYGTRVGFCFSQLSLCFALSRASLGLHFGVCDGSSTKWHRKKTFL